MIRRYDFGCPVETGAIPEKPEALRDSVPYFTQTTREGRLCFTLALDKDDMIFGLGEQIRGINKRGHLYVSWNLDDPNQNESRSSLYAAHNFLVFVQEERTFGVYFDDPGRITFDLGYTHGGEAVITSENGDLSVYVVDGPDAVSVCRAFRKLIGRSYIPPRWAMGYMQSRWGYASEEDFRKVVREHRERHIPLDSVCMDIDYMDNYKDFTWNRQLIPDLTKLSADLKRDHIRLVPIIDAGVKVLDGYDVYEEGEQKGYFCKKADGTDFVGAVWPGRSVFPDFLRPEVRQWFGDHYHRLLEQGVEGFWNDMNEPALFYSEETLQAAFEELENLKGQNLDINGVFHLKDIVNNLANNMEDYRRFYHQCGDRRVRHDKVHNLYGAHMTRAAAEGFRSYAPEKRFLMFSRSSFIGSHRYGGVWQGDNSAWWGHILQNLRELPALNMCGFLFNGADIGGFGGNTTEDLLLRWLQLGVFTPLLRNHACLGTREQEIYRFDNWEAMRDVLTVRYALLPYLYSEFMQAALTDDLMFRPLAFDYPEDTVACHTEDQVMLGHDCMIAPVYEQNAIGRHVYLPEDMLMVRFRSAEDYDLVPVPAGHCWVNLQLHEFPLFIRKNHVIPLARAAEYSEAVSVEGLRLLGWMESDTEVHTQLYWDDGVTTEPVLEDGLTAIDLVQDGMSLHCSMEDADLTGVVIE